jgi:hypothetical protein
MRVEAGPTIAATAALAVTERGVLGLRGARFVVSAEDATTYQEGDAARGSVEGRLSRWSGGLLDRLSRRRAFAAAPASSIAHHVLVLLRHRAVLVDAYTGRVLGERALPVGRTLCQGLERAPGGGWLMSPYTRNPSRAPIDIQHLSEDLSALRVVRRLRGIRHLHTIQRDPFSERIWYATGDRDEECRIGWVDDPTQAPSWIGGGAQHWRAVSLHFTTDYVLWGSDDPRGSNAFFRWHRETREVEKIADADGPIYYSAACGDGAMFFSSVEVVQLEANVAARPWVFDGERIHDAPFTGDVGPWVKDRWGVRAFGYGVVEPARHVGSEPPDRVWVTLWGFAGGLRSQCLRLSV